MCCNHQRTPSAVRHRPMTGRSGTRVRRQLAPPDPTNMPADLQDHVACLLEPDDDGDAGGATLTALLATAPATQESIPSPSRTSSSMNWDGDEEGLARRALRGRERWVFCRSSPSPSSSSSDEAASSDGFNLYHGAPPISLKLDYEEVLTAWSGRGSLYIDGDGPQIVPEPHDATVFVEVGSVGNAWRVPELGAVKEEEQTAAEEKEAVVASREARVLRYKEKRRSRLFAKRIRYEVRKLNAEKRPRMKGRFVKRKDDE